MGNTNVIEYIKHTRFYLSNVLELRGSFQTVPELHARKMWFHLSKNLPISMCVQLCCGVFFMFKALALNGVSNSVWCHWSTGCSLRHLQKTFLGETWLKLSASFVHFPATSHRSGEHAKYPKLRMKPVTLELWGGNATLTVQICLIVLLI